MSILKKSLDTISIRDLEELCISETRETTELEFKGTLPFAPQKGQSQTVDRWIEKGDRLGDYARDALLAEVVAFANAEGGTLIIGLHESKEEPRHATKLEALPNCEGLVKRLIDACEDVIEPRLMSVTGRALPIEDAGSGYVLIRVGQSPIGPHRLKSTREFYVRRGERSVKMDVREIRDLTLELARTGDRIEQAFQRRRAISLGAYSELMRAPDKGGPSALLVRVSAIPIGSITIADITRRSDLWWSGNAFTARVGEVDYPCGYPAREFSHRPEIRLRSLIAAPDPEEDGSSRTIQADGLVEFSFSHAKREPLTRTGSANRIYVGWLLCLLAGALAQLHQIRARLAWDAIEYGLEIEIYSAKPLSVFWDDRGLRTGLGIRDELPLLLPRYSVLQDSNYDPIIRMVVSDLFNACGRSFNESIELPWPELGVE